jgi:hypothetical protein
MQGDIIIITLSNNININITTIIIFCSVTNSNDLSLDDDYKFRVKITPDGFVQWQPFFQWTTSCDLDLTYFPIDQHNCYVTIINWIYRASLVNFTLGTSPADPDAIAMHYYSTSSDWMLIRVYSMQGNVTGKVDRG